MFRVHNQKGYALALVILVVAILSIIGAALMVAARGEHVFTSRQKDKTQAYYVAKSGAEAMALWIEDTDTTLAEINTIVSGNTTNTDTWTDFPSGGRFKIHFSGDQYSPVIHSEGEYKSITKNVSLLLDKRSYFDYAVTVVGTLGLNQANTDVYGDVALANGAIIDDDSGTIHGDVYDITREFETPTTSLPNSSMGDYVPIDPDSPYDYEFEISGLTKVRIDNIDENNKTIHVTGDGTLIIFADTVSFKGNLYTDSDCKTILNILDNGNLNFQTGSSEFQGFIYGPTADIVIRANMEGVGAVVARNLDLSSGGSIEFDSDLADSIYPEDMGLSSLGYDREVWGD